MAASLLSRYRLMGVPSPAEPLNRSLATSIMRILYQHAGQDNRLARQEAAQPDPDAARIQRLGQDFSQTEREISRLHTTQRFPLVPGANHKLSPEGNLLQSLARKQPANTPPTKGYVRKYPKGQAPRGRRKGSKPKKTEVERLREIAGTASAAGTRRKPRGRPPKQARAAEAAAEAVLDLSGEAASDYDAIYQAGRASILAQMVGPEGASGIAAPGINARQFPGERRARPDVEGISRQPYQRPRQRQRMASDEAMMDEAGDLMAANIERQRVQAALEEGRNNLPNVIPAVYNAANNIQVPPAPILMAEAAASAAQEAEPDVQPT